MPESTERMRHELQELFRKQLNLYTTMSLATADRSGSVDCASVYYAPDGPGVLYFATDTVDVRKVVHLRENNRVAAVMDDGGRTTQGIQIRGTAEELTGAADIRRAREMLLGRVPVVAQFLAKPTVKLYRLVPLERYLINFSWGVDWRRPVPF